MTLSVCLSAVVLRSLSLSLSHPFIDILNFFSTFSVRVFSASFVCVFCVSVIVVLISCRHFDTERIFGAFRRRIKRFYWLTDWSKLIKSCFNTHSLSQLIQNWKLKSVCFLSFSSFYYLLFHFHYVHVLCGRAPKHNHSQLSIQSITVDVRCVNVCEWR